MKPDTIAAGHAADLAKSLEELDHLELFRFIQALLVLNTDARLGERTRELFEALIKLMADWISKPQKKKK